MCGGAKQTTKQTSTYTPTAQATGLYNNVIGQATNAATTPYNPATQQQVANFTPDQLAAFGMVSDAQGAWSPYTDRAGQLFEQSAAPISADAISNYMNPYQQMVLDASLAQSQRADAIQQNMLKGNAIAGGALGGNATGVAAAQLAGEQGRNRDSMIANLLSGGYSQALNAAQSDAARQAGIGAQFGQLGQMVQGLSLNDIQARLGIGNQQQQQGQAQLDAASANAQAETMWPYQNAQWLASIAAGIGPLTGGTTTGTAKTQQGKGIGNVIGAGLSAAAALSDRRAKEGERIIGKTFDGQNVYSFRYKGSPKTQIGLMADEVQRHHPEAVGVGPYGLKTVDYDKATREFANGGTVGDAFGGAGAKFFPWAPIVASQPAMPQLAVPSGGGTGETGNQSGFDPAESIRMGKAARGGIDDFLRGIDPAKGWGASIEGASGAGGGDMFGKLASLFGKGFANGGEVERSAPYVRPRFIDASAESQDNSGQIPLNSDLANALTDLLINDPTMYGDNAHSPDDVFRSFANGGFARPLDGVNMAFLSPDVMTPYDLRPQRVPPLEDEFIGEIGPSGMGDLPEPGQLPVDALDRFPKQNAPAPETVPQDFSASNERMMRSFEDAERKAGITTPAEPESSWSLDNGTVRYKGKSFADWLAGREGTPAPATEAATSWGAGIEAAPQTPYSDTFPDMAGAMGDPAAAAGPGGELTPGASFSDQTAPAPQEKPVASGAFDTLGFIRQQEGFRETAYPDGRQTSIGYGTRGRPGEKITRVEAERRLEREAGAVERWIDDNVTVDMTPQQRGALVSFGFNLGTGALDKLAGDINNGDWSRVAGRMKTFNKIRDEETGKLVPSKGLTSRRVREAALVSGGASLPEAGTLPEETEQLVTRGMDPSAPEGSYSGKQDKQAGGLLKRMFGIDFNPLKLDEDERQALLVAGLSMMSSGDVGAGGLQGMRYLQQRQASDREAAMAAAKLGMDMFKTASDIDIAQQRLDLDRAGKPTDDARNYQLAKDEGFAGTFMDFMREKKLLDKGGAEIPAEVAARIGLGRVFIKDVPTITGELKEFTAGDRADLLANRGRAADVWRRIESGREALVRQLTGAGMSAAEAENQTKRYQIQATDRNETMIRKVQMLERDLKAVEEGALAGKSGQMTREYQSGASSIARPSTSISSTRRARDPKTGKVYEDNGSAWVEVHP